RYYLSSSRELTRIDGLTKSPILAHFSETLAGAAVIRAFAQEERFEIENADAVDNNMRAYFHYYGAIYWLGLRLETISAVVLAFVAFLLVLVPQGTIEPGLAGVSLAYGLTLNMALVMTMWHLSNLENKLVAVDRIRHFSAIPSEAPLIVEGNRPSADWPNRGSISFENLQMRYREAMPLVLKGVTVTFRGGEKVGVVGRTGSGKSTLVVALFRLVEPVGGRVMIDGVDISTIGLQDLRSRLAIIPQDPTLFEGTVRSNLDPLGRYHSSLLWEVLEKCQLAEAVMDKEDKLDAIVVEGGENWSVGQRQLFCLARALLKRSRILVLDEATASVDSATDAIIQRTIKENFARATVITVAHRIPSVIDSDKVLVLEAGRVEEFDSPVRLLANKRSLFSQLVAEYSKRTNTVANLSAMVYLSLVSPSTPSLLFQPSASLLLTLYLIPLPFPRPSAPSPSSQQSPITPATAFLTATAFANPAAIALPVLPSIANPGELTKLSKMRNAGTLANAAMLANSGVLAKLAQLPHPINVSSWRNHSLGVAERQFPLPAALTPARLAGASFFGRVNDAVNSFSGRCACSAAASNGHDASASVLDAEGSASVITIATESPRTSIAASADTELTITSMSGLVEEASGRGKGRRGRPKGRGEKGTRGEGGGKGTVKGKQMRILVEEVGGEGLVGEGGEEGIGADGSVGKRYPDIELRAVGEGSIQSDSNGSSNDAVSEVVVVRRTQGRRKTAELTEKKEEGEREGAKGGENFVVEAREKGRWGFSPPKADSKVRTESPDSVLPTTGGTDSMRSDSNKSESNGSESLIEVLVVRRTRGRRKSAELTEMKEEVGMEGGREGDGEGKKKGRGRQKAKEERVNDLEGRGTGDAGDDMWMGVRTDSAGAVCGDVREPVCGDVREPVCGDVREPVCGDVREPVCGDVREPVCGDVRDPVCGDVREPVCGDVRDPVCVDMGRNTPPSVNVRDRVCGDVANTPPEDGDGNSLLRFLQNLALEAVGGDSDMEGERGPHVPAPTTLDPMESRKRAWHADISQRHPEGAVILGVDPDVLGAVAVLFVKPRRKQEAESCAVSVVNTRSGQEEQQGDGAEKDLRLQSCSEAIFEAPQKRIFEAPQKVLCVQSCSEAAQHAATSEWEERLTVAAAEAVREGGGGIVGGAVEEEEGEEECERVWELEEEMEGWTRMSPGGDGADGLEEGRAMVYGQIHDVPYELVSVGVSNRKRHSAQAIASLLHQLPPAPVRLAYVEQARPFPSDGKQGWYGCGFGFGVWMGVLAASGFEVTTVTSVRWKAAIRSQGSLPFTSKEDSRQLALSLFPSLAAQLKRKKDHGRAEALLIATYGTNLWPPSGEKVKKTRGRAKAAIGEAVRTGEGMEDGSSRMEAKEDSEPWSMPLPVI
ncbi:unnamed protein product, partial [Closterium sp. NIES-53]